MIAMCGIDRGCRRVSSSGLDSGIVAECWAMGCTVTGLEKDWPLGSLLMHGVCRIRRWLVGAGFDVSVGGQPVAVNRGIEKDWPLCSAAV